MDPNRRPRTPLHLLATAALLLGMAGCSSDDRADVESEATTSVPLGSIEGAWTDDLLEGEPGPDSPVQRASDGDQVVISFISDEGRLSGFSSAGDGQPFDAGTPLDTGIEYVHLGGTAKVGTRWLTIGSGGREDVDGDSQGTFDLHVFASPDGRTWTTVATEGLDGPADVESVAATDHGVVAVGARRRNPDPGGGGFRATAWTSTDGDAWDEVELPGADRGESYTTGVVATPDGNLLATGAIEDAGVLWTSSDGGATWSSLEPEGIDDGVRLRYPVGTGEVLLASTEGTAGEDGELGDEQATQVVRSLDGGRTWTEASDPPPQGEGYATPIFVGGGRALTTRGTFVEAYADPALCYADIELCRQDTQVSLYASDDLGDTWYLADISGIEADEYGEVDGAIGSASGRLVLQVGDTDGIAAWSWPAGAELPRGEEPEPPDTDAVRLLGDDEQPEPGTTYAAPLFVHCGMDWLYLGGEPWKRTDDGPDVETGAGDPADPSWPLAQQTIFGFATVVAPDEVEYSLEDGTVIATYGATTEDPPGCA